MTLVRNQRTSKPTPIRAEPVRVTSVRTPAQVEPVVIELKDLKRSEQLKVLKHMGFTGSAALELRALSLGERQGDRIDLDQAQPKRRSKKN